MKFREETGSAQVVEMTLIFPFVVLVIAFLLYTGSYILQSVNIYTYTQQIAVSASKEIAFPGYDKLYEGSPITSHVDFNWPGGYCPQKALIDLIMSEHKPYRYWTDKSLDQSRITELEDNLEKLIAGTSFLFQSSTTCDISISNNIINQKVSVHVTRKLNMPPLMKLLGLNDNTYIDVTATAVSSDAPELIRNTDFVIDITNELLDTKLKGGQTIREKIDIYKQKITDTMAKFR